MVFMLFIKSKVEKFLVLDILAKKSEKENKNE